MPQLGLQTSRVLQPLLATALLLSTGCENGGAPPPDAAVDAYVEVADATPQSGPRDAATPDAFQFDGSNPDAAPLDAGPAPLDAGPAPLDAGPAPVDAGPGPVDAGPAPVDAGPAPLDAGPGAVDAGPGAVPGTIIVRPAAHRTILPNCIDGIVYSGFGPPCMVGNQGVTSGQVYAIEYHFDTTVVPLSGDFDIDETGGGGYDMALSVVPGEMTPPIDACHALFGGFPSIHFLDEATAATLVPTPRRPDPLAGTCVIDPARTYYLNIHVVDARCDAADRSTPRCWPIILEPEGLVR